MVDLIDDLSRPGLLGCEVVDCGLAGLTIAEDLFKLCWYPIIDLLILVGGQIAKV